MGSSKKGESRKPCTASAKLHLGLRLRIEYVRPEPIWFPKMLLVPVVVISKALHHALKFYILHLGACIHNGLSLSLSSSYAGSFKRERATSSAPVIDLKHKNSRKDAASYDSPSIDKPPPACSSPTRSRPSNS